MPGPVLGQGTSTYTGYLFVSGQDIMRSVPLDIAPIEWEDTGGAVGNLSFTVQDTAANRQLVGGMDVRLVVNSTTVFGGTLIRRRFTRMPGTGRYIECDVVSYDSWLDWRIVPRWSSRTDLGNRVRKITTDRGMVKDLIERRGGPIEATNNTVDETKTNMDPVRIGGDARTTLRDALDIIADEAQSDGSQGTRRYYVDEKLHLHWYTGLEGGTAPYRIADGSYTRDVIDTSGLVEYWSLREEGGTTNHGSQGVANLTLAGSYTQGITLVGVVNEPYRAATFTATGRSVKTSAPASLFPGDTFSLECWFRRTGTGTTQYLILTSGSTDNAYEVFFDASDKLTVRLRTGAANNFVATDAITDSFYHHLVIAHNPGDTTVYVDGASIAGTHTNRVFGSAADTWQISHSSTGFVGQLHHVAVYSSKLSAATALAHYRQGVSIAPEDLDLEDDWGEVMHHAYVIGKNNDGSGWVYNVGSDFERGAVQAFVERENADTARERNAAGRAAIRKASRVRAGSFSTRIAGAWRVGQTVPITDDAFGLSNESFEVTNVTGSLGVDGLVQDIDYGALKRSLLRQIKRRDRRRRR